ncbi:8-amino-7-oxononanoate synthase [Chromatiaceae bacterium AAb-1]|nr:8-amino-7-oxononanoate synthase [Chromatiaceae bacterium AAb-1]
MQLAQLQQALAQRAEQQLLRQPLTLDTYQGRYLQWQQQRYLNFSANDYLGLATEPEVLQAYADGAARYGAGSSGSPLVTGQHQVHRQLTAQLADWLGFERVLLFSSGFAANQAMLLTLTDKQDVLLLDRLCHASLIDAALHSPARMKRFAHNDSDALQRQLVVEQQAMVVTEGVFSMDGDSPDLAAINQLCQQYQSPLLLDDAHGLGVQGEQGRGSWQQQGLPATDIFCYMANFGKALGCGGAFLAGSKTVIDYLEQFARHYVFSTGLSPALCAAISKSIELCRNQPWRREKLAENIALFRRLAAAAELPVLNSTSAIQAVVLGAADKAVDTSQRLRQQHLWLTAIRPPTVAPNTSRLRITLSSQHQPEDIRYLVSQLQQCL